MIVKQIYTYNNYRNFNYLIACPLTREAIATTSEPMRLSAELFGGKRRKRRSSKKKLTKSKNTGNTANKQLIQKYA